MKRGLLADNLVGVGMKRLSEIDIKPVASRWHAVGTTKQMRQDFLGDNKKKEFQTAYIWLNEEQDVVTDHGVTTLKEVVGVPPSKSSEWVLYYESNHVTNIMESGDTLVLAKSRNETLLFIVVPQESGGEKQIFQLFGFQPEDANFMSREITNTNPDLDFVVRNLLDELGVELEEPDACILDEIIELLDDRFPSAIDLSRVARNSLPDVDATCNPDSTLMAWLDREMALFQRLERLNLAEKLEQGFIKKGAAGVKGFLNLSNSVMSRRKSWFRQSLETQVEAILLAHKFLFERDTFTADGGMGEFRFLGIDMYTTTPHRDKHPVTLYVNATRSDQWRQVRANAPLNPNKYILTIERSLSKSQITQMQKSNLNVVVPRLPSYNLFRHATATAVVNPGLH